jgi:hypothetical protein
MMRGTTSDIRIRRFAMLIAAVAAVGCGPVADPADPHYVIAPPPPLAASDAARMHQGPEGAAMSYYANPNADWPRYSRVMLAPVTSWDGNFAGQVSPEDQIVLCDYMYEVLRRHLARQFVITDSPGPDVMRLKIAIVARGGAATGLRSVSSPLPDYRLERAVAELSPATYAFAGIAASDGEITDSTTGAPLLIWIDQRIGGGTTKPAAQWNWNDTRAAIEYWAETLTGRLAQWHQEGDVSG